MEPERNIEKLLRAFAKKRRDQAGAPLELHPATRRLLQSEAARQGSKTGGRGFFLNVFSLLRPRLALIACTAVAALVGVALLLPQWTGNETQSIARGPAADELMKQRSQSAPDDARPAATTAPAAETPAPPAVRSRFDQDGFADAARRQEDSKEFAEPGKLRDAADLRFNVEKSKTEIAASKDAALNENQPVPPVTQPEPVTLDVAETASASGALVQRKGTDEIDGFAGTPPATTAPAQVPLLAGAVGGKPDLAQTNTVLLGAVAPASPPPGSAAVPERFYRVTVPAEARAASLAAEPTPLLANFQIDQKGANIRIVDQDGSVYSGYAQLADAEAPTGAVAMTDAARKPQARVVNGNDVEPIAQNYSFRVTGTNRSLNQKVVFIGTYSKDPAAPARRSVTASESEALSRRATAEVQAPAARVSGRAVIDDRREIQIDAVMRP